MAAVRRLGLAIARRLPPPLGAESWFVALAYPWTGSIEWTRRHAVLIGELERIRGGRDSISVLDFGGAGGSLSAALRLYGRDRFYRVTVADVDAAALPPGGLLLDPGGGIPAGDDAYDAAVSSDVFEHIPDADRARWAAELLRVAPAQAHTLPADGAGGAWESTWADRRLDAWHRRRFGRPDRWTAEHLAQPEPTVEEAQGWFPGAEVRGFANAEVWVRLLREQHSGRGLAGRCLFAARYLVSLRPRDGRAPWKAALVTARR